MYAQACNPSTQEAQEDCWCEANLGLHNYTLSQKQTKKTNTTQHNKHKNPKAISVSFLYSKLKKCPLLHTTMQKPHL